MIFLVRRLAFCCLLVRNELMVYIMSAMEKVMFVSKGGLAGVSLGFAAAALLGIFFTPPIIVIDGIALTLGLLGAVYASTLSD